MGITGLSGVGKSTLVDILVGLLNVNAGSICVDGKKLSEEDYPNFRHIIGYVPQQIKILDASFRNNVAWGVPDENIDDNKVIEALKQAQLYDVVSAYSDGIYAKAIIGSNGISQGQKQRLAIARALYNDADILILDEATSSLDVKTEDNITQMLKSVKKDKTIIAIAHRLSTLKYCNKLLYIQNSKIHETGTIDELKSKYDDFNQLIELSSIKNDETV